MSGSVILRIYSPTLHYNLFVKKEQKGFPLQLGLKTKDCT